ncbi:glycosyltransferase family 2 protein [Pedobacter aquatilis]|uniref:glycosyltransferase family 2 protein n=1 Tax=Pedobacter aquatilis TaxID=351343 RepID=UPI0025B5D754|nr:glycosyltransferase family 2 protein [Pedobacter aquatilis]MDN3585385.1 glycosyltransferase family 2 protein [Pedobacter aquatilis]
MNPKPLVTVIIPTYNRETKVFEAIESAIKQTYTEVQIVVIDDGSNDNTAKILKEKYPNIEYFYKTNGGQASARNLGLSKARGEIVASLDSDDIWYPNFLEVCVQKLQQDDLDFVFANWDQDRKVGDSWDFLINDPYLKPYQNLLKNDWIDLKHENLRALYIRACPSPSSSVVLRKSSIVSGWDENINIGDDWCLYLEMILNRKAKAAYTLQRLWRKRIDEINIYDGRKWHEILEYLYIADLNLKIKRFGALLTKDELLIMQRRYMHSLVELSKHYLFRERSFNNSMKLLSRSFSVNFPFTLKTIPVVYFQAFEREFKRKFGKENK